MQETTHTLKVAGRDLHYRHVDLVIPVFALLLRLSMGFIFIWAGFDKLITDFSASGFLVNASKGPLKDLFVNMGESNVAINVVDPLVVYGQILIGFSLILGIFTRFGLLMGAAQLFLFYLAQLWPEFNPFLDEHIVYILLMALLGALGAGRILGLDGLIERWEPVKRVRPLEYALG
ncbi:MAG: DoxX family protein [Chloroflexi bacterium]|nr:DoxX family protein [Chloroflexota bacterium]